jgi:hypothetical protein
MFIDDRSDGSEFLLDPKKRPLTRQEAQDMVNREFEKFNKEITQEIRDAFRRLRCLY